KQKCSDFDYILASLTGSASFLIGGETIHSAFCIPTFQERRASNVIEQEVTDDIVVENTTKSTATEKQKQKLSNS
ncbi:unnamed protein product, partial [Allacma fusca]